MALRTFETQDARYYLGLGDHRCSSLPLFEDVDFQSLDFLVLESGGLTEPLELVEHPQYSELLARWQTENKGAKIYSVDPPVQNIDSAELIEWGINTSIVLGALYSTGAGIGSLFLLDEPVIGIPLLGLSGLLTSATYFSVTENTTTWRSKSKSSYPCFINSLKTTFIPTPLMAFRDTIAAAKISQFLVPRHRREDGSKVEGAILYGYGHTGIEWKLRYPWISRATAGLYHRRIQENNAAINEVRELVLGADDFIRYDSKVF
ncbi:hypothetical protein HY496_03350 [Candidatus Woesearchaeota archaeon]|nr:hypothetical protein [Candidatus Woesearchaeota archaeon]